MSDELVREFTDLIVRMDADELGVIELLLRAWQAGYHAEVQALAREAPPAAEWRPRLEALLGAAHSHDRA